MLPQWHVKDRGQSAQNTGGRLQIKHAYTLDPTKIQTGLTMLSRQSVGTYQRNELTCDLSQNSWPQLSQLAEPLWTDSGLKSGICLLYTSDAADDC